MEACLLSIIGFVESIAISKTYASAHNYQVSPNRELVALGFANFISSFFGAYPSFGSLARSKVNDVSGARTQLAGFMSGKFICIECPVNNSF
jgi:MFS superfamily sulfate permease-like transporter